MGKLEVGQGSPETAVAAAVTYEEALLQSREHPVEKVEENWVQGHQMEEDLQTDFEPC